MAVDRDDLVQEIRIHLNKKSARTVERLFNRLEKMEEKIKKLSSMKIAPKVDNAAIRKANKDLEQLKVDKAVRRSRTELERHSSGMTPSQLGSAKGVLTRQANALTAAIAAGVPVEKALQVFTQRRAAAMDKIVKSSRIISKNESEILKARRKTARLMNEQGFKAGNTQKFRADLLKTTNELKRGEISVEQYRIKVERLHRQIAKGTGLRRLANQLRDVRHAVVGLSAAYAAFNFGAHTFRIGGQFESLRATMLMASGDMQTAGKDLQFVTAEANRLGQELRFATDGYVKLAVASRNKLDDKQVKELFTGFSEFATAMGTDQFRYEKGIMAIGQMLSKGQIYREELVGQLAEQMPGALQVFSKALGVTDAELLKMSERGELLASEVFPLVAKEFANAARQGGALAQQLKNPTRAVMTMRNKFKEMVHEFFRSGFGRAIANIAVSLSGLLEVGKAIAPLFGGAVLGALTALTLPLAIISDSLRLIVMLFTWIGDKITETFGEKAGKAVKNVAFAVMVLLGGIVGMVGAITKLLKLLGRLKSFASKLLPQKVKDVAAATAKRTVETSVKNRPVAAAVKAVPIVGTAAGLGLEGYSTYQRITGKDKTSAYERMMTMVPSAGAGVGGAAVGAKIGSWLRGMFTDSGNSGGQVTLNVITEESDLLKTKVEVIDQVGNVRNNISE